jgi:AraC-like DNA-binding protein
MSQTSQRYAAGELIERHRHDDHQLIYVSQGILAVATGSGTWVASADRGIWVPAWTWHEHRVHGNSSVHTISFPTANAPLPDRTPTVIAVDNLLGELLVACTDPGLPEGESRRIRAVLRDRLRRAHVQPLALPTPHDPRLAHACRLVTDDLSRTRTMAWLASQVGASERTLARLFRSEFGATYPQWRTNTRVFHAMIHLSEGAAVTETAHRCGWATTSAFIDTFARTMGQTPGAYRSATTSTDGRLHDHGLNRGTGAHADHVEAERTAKTSIRL